MDLDAEKLMPLLKIALALAFAALAAIGFLLTRSRRQQHKRTLRSNNRRVEEAQIVREWEELQQRLRDRAPAACRQASSVADSPP